VPDPSLVEWLDAHAGAFDVAASAVEWARRLFPDSRVGDVLEAYTLQVLTPESRPIAEDFLDAGLPTTCGVRGRRHHGRS
jgi:hypothetical protein